MNRMVVFMLLFVGTVLATESFFAHINPKSIPAILNNRDVVEVHANCIMATPEQAKRICDKTGQKARERIPLVMKTGKCPPPCLDSDLPWVAYLFLRLKKDHAATFKRVGDHLGVTPEQYKKVDEFIASTPLPPEVAGTV